MAKQYPWQNFRLLSQYQPPPRSQNHAVTFSTNKAARSYHVIRAPDMHGSFQVREQFWARADSSVESNSRWQTATLWRTWSDTWGSFQGAVTWYEHCARLQLFSRCVPIRPVNNKHAGWWIAPCLQRVGVSAKCLVPFRNVQQLQPYVHLSSLPVKFGGLFFLAASGKDRPYIFDFPQMFADSFGVNISIDAHTDRN